MCVCGSGFSAVNGEAMLPTFDLCVDYFVICPYMKNLSDPEDYTKYFICNGTKLHPRSCNAGETFHQNAFTCKKSGQPFCRGECVWVVQFTIQGSHRRPERNNKVDQSFGSDNDTCDIDFRLRRRVCRSVQLQIRGRKRSLTGRQ